jgi:hypothetical protein
MKEVEEFLNQSYIKQKDRIVEEIVKYLSYTYPSVKVFYENLNFKIEGENTEELESCKEKILEMLNFAKK